MTAGLGLFLMRRIGIQEGPGLCAEKVGAAYSPRGKHTQ